MLPHPAWIAHLTDADIDQMGRSLRRIRQGINSSPRPNTTKVWYQGGEPYFNVVLEIDQDKGCIVNLQVTCRGQFVQWQGDRDHIETGRTSELDPPSGTAYTPSNTLHPSQRVDRQFLTLIQAILAAQPNDQLLAQAAACLATYQAESSEPA